MYDEVPGQWPTPPAPMCHAASDGATARRSHRALRTPRPPARSAPAARSGPRSAARAFTIVEIIVVIVIIGVIAAVIAPRLFSRIGTSKQAVAESNAQALAKQVELFRMDHAMPEPGSTIDILFERPSSVPEDRWEPYVRNADELLDPWGNKFVLVIPGQKNTFDFDVVSYGADGKPGGTGENADVIKP